MSSRMHASSPTAADPPPGRRLVLLRHGRTAWNAAHRVQGHADVDLDAVGHAQAASAATALAGLNPSAVWSSDLARAASTARYLAAVCGREVRADPRLREFDLGERTGLSISDYAAAHPDEYALFRAGRYDVVPGGESAPEVTARMQDAIKDALAAVNPGESVAVVSHAAALKLTLVALLDLPESAAASLRALDNGGWMVLEETPPAGRLRLTAYNLRAPDSPDFVAPGRVG
ncbi:MAG: histidine phosphatase family protein [Nocardioides sp.]